MFDNSDRLVSKRPLHVFEVMKIRVDGERRSWPSRLQPPPASEIRDVSGSGPDSDTTLQSALQALRDVRHLLPADGVAIVDAVLERYP
jgi:hypothetical protein